MVERREVPRQENKIFVRQGQESEFCRRHNVEYRELNNGVKILGMGKEDSERSHVSLQVNSPSGYLSDPVGKSGAHHLVEHLVASELSMKSEKQGVSLTAMTGPFNFIIEANDAVFDPADKNLGMGAVPSDIREVFNNPFHLIGDMSTAVLREKEVLVAELIERSSREQLTRAMYSNIFASDNPYAGVTETFESLGDLSPEDVYPTAQVIFQPKELVLASFVESKDKRASRQVVDHISDAFETYHESPFPRQEADRDRMDLLSDKFLPDVIYHHSTQSPQLTYLNFFWNMPFEQHSIEDLSLQHYGDLLQRNLHRFMRQNGIGYSSHIEVKDLHKKRLLEAGLQIPHLTDDSTREKEKLAAIRDIFATDVIGGITDEEVDEYAVVSKRQREIVSPSSFAKYRVLKEGLTKHQRLIDLDELNRRTALGATSEEMLKWRDYFQDNFPTVVMISF